MNLPGLSVPFAQLDFRVNESRKEIFDRFRKKWVMLTQEEWVRQQVLDYLVTHRNFPKGMISVETGLSYSGLKKRSDARVYIPGGDILLLMEFKAASNPVSENTFVQAAAYAKILKPDFIFLSNGLQHYWIKCKLVMNGWNDGIPDYLELMKNRNLI